MKYSGENVPRQRLKVFGGWRKEGKFLLGLGSNFPLPVGWSLQPREGWNHGHVTDVTVQ